MSLLGSSVSMSFAVSNIVHRLFVLVTVRVFPGRGTWSNNDFGWFRDIDWLLLGLGANFNLGVRARAGGIRVRVRGTRRVFFNGGLHL
jgi:hypothetical protein